jgi:hypothetical protein
LTSNTEIINLQSVTQLPTLEYIKSIPRNRTIKLVFDHTLKNQRETIGEDLKRQLDEFLVEIHFIEPEINITKLIADFEIEQNQDFFEKCAKDYRVLSTELIFKLAEKLEVSIHPHFPLITFNSLKCTEKDRGTIGDWRYYLHGFHCGFDHVITGQLIETPLTFGFEFGELDPYFFTKFIKSTPQYQPLPVDIYEDYADGVRINEKMVSLGKFERINSNIANRSGVVVSDRNKVDIKLYNEIPVQK